MRTMTREVSILIVLWLVFSVMPASGRIVIITLDVSRSMEPHFDKVRETLIRRILTERLSVGDYLVFITFAQEAEELYSGNLTDETAREEIIEFVQAIDANKSYTDLGKALKSTLSRIARLKELSEYRDTEPLVVFITDGNHEPATDSEFYDRSIDELFDDVIIQEQALYDGWFVLALGANLQDVKRIAELADIEDRLLNIEEPETMAQQMDQFLAEALEKGEIQLTELLYMGVPLPPDSQTGLPADPDVQLALRFFSTFKSTAFRIQIVALVAQLSSGNTQSFPLNVHYTPSFDIRPDEHVDVGFALDIPRDTIVSNSYELAIDVEYTYSSTYADGSGQIALRRSVQFAQQRRSIIAQLFPRNSELLCPTAAESAVER